VKNDTKSKKSEKSRKSLGGKRPGAGRPGLGDSRKLQIYVPGAVADRLQAQADDSGVRLVEHVRGILEAAARR
jgi:hypothetical protein